MGFGLFVPEFRADFALSSTTIGVLSSIGFLGFLVSLLLAQPLLMRRGPEAPVVTGLWSATVGMAVVAVAGNVYVLALGLFLAAASAGFVWTPFNDAVNRKVREDLRPSALSAVSTGTGVGIVAAGCATLFIVWTGVSWRYCWAAFAAASGAVLFANWLALRDIEKRERSDLTITSGLAEVVRPEAAPLLLIGFVFGTTTAIYLSFVADRIQEAGGLPGFSTTTVPALVFILYGLFGLAGLFTNAAKDALGLTWLLRALMMAGSVSAALVALAPGNVFGLGVSAALQGIFVMMTSAVLAFWSERLFPSMPSMSFTAVLLAMALGSVIGPSVAGIASDAIGPTAMFLATAAMPLATALILRRRQVRQFAVSEAAQGPSGGGPSNMGAGV